MTTEVTVKVPAGANYEVEVSYKDAPGALPQTMTVKPGSTLVFHIWGQKRVTDIREIPI